MNFQMWANGDGLPVGNTGVVDLGPTAGVGLGTAGIGAAPDLVAEMQQLIDEMSRFLSEIPATLLNFSWNDIPKVFFLFTYKSILLSIKINVSKFSRIIITFRPNNYICLLLPRLVIWNQSIFPRIVFIFN